MLTRIPGFKEKWQLIDSMFEVILIYGKIMKTFEQLFYKITWEVLSFVLDK